MCVYIYIICFWWHYLYFLSQFQKGWMQCVKIYVFMFASQITSILYKSKKICAKGETSSDILFWSSFKSHHLRCDSQRGAQVKDTKDTTENPDSNPQSAMTALWIILYQTLSQPNHESQLGEFVPVTLFSAKPTSRLDMRKRGRKEHYL